MRTLLFFSIAFLFLASSSKAQRTNYYAYLSEKLNYHEVGLNFEPAIYPSKNGGFFLADNGKFNHIRITKFNVFGQKDWQKYISFPFDGLTFYNLKENLDGRIVVLAQSILSRNWEDVVCFVLNSSGELINNYYVIPKNLKLNNVPQNFEIYGDTLFAFGTLMPYSGSVWPKGFYSKVNIETGEIFSFKEFPLPGFSYQIFHLLSYNNKQTQFIISIKDTSSKKSSMDYVGILKVDHINDTYSFKTLKDSAGIIIQVNFESLDDFADYSYINVNSNPFDSSSILMVSFNTPIAPSFNGYTLIKFDKTGKIVNSKLKKSLSLIGHDILSMASNNLGFSKALIADFNISNNENFMFLSDIDSELNESNKVLFFPQSKYFEEYILKENIQVGIFRNEVTSTNTKPNLIFDKQGDLIFCGEVVTNDSGFVSKILVVKLNSKGELVSLNKTDQYNISAFEIYPNPCEDILTVNLPKEHKYDLEIIDLNGRIIQHFLSSDYTNLPISDLLPGSYYLNIINQNTQEKVCRKFIKIQ